MRIQEIIVVEGRDDTAAIQRAVEADTIETGGSAINAEIIERIRLAQERRGVIIFTDPDYPGERIRKLISQAIPECKHAFLPKQKARSKKGRIGVEYATVADILQALEDARFEVDKQEEYISWSYVQQLGIVGLPTSRRLRFAIGEKLGIGCCNGKQFYKRIHAFCISQEELEQAYQETMQELANE